ncbi:hypothetical protein E3E35_08365 [Thermococcus sp. GR7]|uniref:transglutaminase-like domain-containing protein n=1 Tax=unclassified Thermococcus TaxID=2627626 RepID=UPI0014302B49|nr:MULTISPECIES: transglutaminase-like domain-containing protein [unclassified Thermococcus]NJE47411.1 hypothetical protein [Thermococcus sp. GR7]NJE78906.1 hypothetical protein [Thermococcus sp. GR4]NJF23099.1 hypothetical protein [Thermococcus sp. GR5]
MPEKDLHYLITRIINPYLNWIIASLRSNNRVLYGRDGYTSIHWVDHTLSDTFASELEEWRNNLWYNYRGDFLERGAEILDSLLEIMIRIEAKLPDNDSKSRIMSNLWEMAMKVEAYLGLNGYLESRKEYFINKAVEIRRRDEELRRKLEKQKKKEGIGSRVNRRLARKSISGSERKIGPTTNKRTFSPTPSQEKPKKKRKWKLPWKKFFGFMLVFLALFAIYDLSHTNGRLVRQSIPDDIEAKILEFWGTVENSTEEVTSVKSLASTAVACSKADYSLGAALECYLNDPDEFRALEPLASQLKGSTLQESAWNILAWEDQHIQYDWAKYHGLGSTKIQKPSETIQSGSGVCVDYAVLTAGLLLAMNYSPVYIFEIDFSNDPMGHAATAIKINGRFFMIDQHPPIMDLGTYWKYWAYWRSEYSDGTLRNLIISSAKVYEARLESGKVVVDYVGTLTGEEFKKYDYTFSEADLTRLISDLRAKFIRKFPNLQLDSKISNLDTATYLPYGYSDGVTWKTTFPDFTEHYNPLFHDEFVDYIYSQITDSREIVSDLRTYNRFWVKGRIEGDNMKVILCLAKK